MRISSANSLTMATLLFLSACGSEDTISPVPDETRPLSGGQATVFDASSQAFEMPIPTLSANELDRFLSGDASFEQIFVTPPAEVNPGAGPVFSHTSCVGCHLRDGRGRGAFGSEPPFVGSMLMRVSLPGYSPHGGPASVPGFGVQLGDRANYGVQPEARVEVSFFETVERLADGEEVYLKHPVYYIVEPYRPLPAGVLLSARMAPPVFGRGLLEAISESDILALSDPADADGDGVSGRPNYVYNFRTDQTELGRFGLKANNPDLLQQVASAYNEDMGVTSPYFPRESVWGQPQHDGRDDDPEISQETLDVTTFYIQTLAVPARRNWDDPQVLRGEILFESTGCAACHTTTFRTGSHAVASLSQARSFIPILICCCTTWATRLPTIDRTSKPMGASGKRPRCGALASRKPSMAFRLDSCTTAGRKPFSKPLCFTVVKLNGRARKCAGYPEPTERHCSPFCDRCRTPHRCDKNRLDYAPSAPVTADASPMQTRGYEPVLVTPCFSMVGEAGFEPATPCSRCDMTGRSR